MPPHGWHFLVLVGSLTTHAMASASAPDPHCATGIVDTDGEACCARECGKCGGSNCQNLHGGNTNCCGGTIAKSGRDCNVTGPPCIIKQPPPAPIGPPAHFPNPKRGFVADGSNCNDAIALNVSGWYYDYNVANTYTSAAAAGDCATAAKVAHLEARFTPMNWCLSGLNASIPSNVNKTFFMGFNEPNNLHNCNKDARTIAAAWGQVMKQWPTSTLVSPATAGNGMQWYKEFFGNCTEMYGPTGCKVSYIATHCYSCNPASTLAYLKEIYDTYGKKVWLTEFSCGDHAQANPTADHIRYMQAVLPLLDAADYVFRYSWMSARDPSSAAVNRGLMETTADGTDQLTDLGRIYNT